MAQLAWSDDKSQAPAQRFAWSDEQQEQATQSGPKPSMTFPKPFAPVPFSSSAQPSNQNDKSGFIEGVKGLGKGIAREIIEPRDGFSGFTPKVQNVLGYSNPTQSMVGNRVKDAADAYGLVELGKGALGFIEGARGALREAPEAENALSPIQQWWKNRGGILKSERPNGPIHGLGPQAKPIEPAPPISPAETRTPSDTAADINRAIANERGQLGDIHRNLQGRTAEMEEKLYPKAEDLRSGLGRISRLTGSAEPSRPLPEIYQQMEPPKYRQFPQVFERIPQQPRGYQHAIDDSGITEGLNRDLEAQGYKAREGIVKDVEDYQRARGAAKSQARALKVAGKPVEANTDLTEGLEKSVKALRKRRPPR